MADDARPFPGFDRPTYTQVPDTVFDMLLPDLSGAELKVLLYIVRRTFGFGKRSDAISLSQICRGITRKDGTVLDRGTGLDRKTATAAVRRLEERGVIVVQRRQDAESGEHATTIYGLHLLEGWGNLAPTVGGRTPLGVGESRHPQETGNKTQPTKGRSPQRPGFHDFPRPTPRYITGLEGEPDAAE